MRSGDGAKLLGDLDPDKGHEIAEVNLVGAAGPRVLDVGEPLGLGLMRWFESAFAATCLLPPCRLEGQRAQQFTCEAASERVSLWPALEASEREKPEAIGADAMAHRITGRYRLLVITTEGREVGKMAAEGVATVRYLGSDSDSKAVREPFEIEFLVAREGYLHAPLRAPAAANQRRLFRGFYHPPDVLRFRGANPDEPPGQLRFDEAAPIYLVNEIVDSVGIIRGRWSAHGLMVPNETPVGTLQESLSGYFCAQRADR